MLLGPETHNQNPISDSDSTISNWLCRIAPMTSDRMALNWYCSEELPSYYSLPYFALLLIRLEDNQRMIGPFLTCELIRTIIGTAIPKITDEFHGLSDVFWCAAAHFMTFTAALIFAGKICRYFDLKPRCLISMLIFDMGSLICTVAPNSKGLVIERAIAGLSAGGRGVGCIVSFNVPPAKRPMMMGYMRTTDAIAAVLDPLLGGAFTVSWPRCFLHQPLH